MLNIQVNIHIGHQMLYASEKHEIFISNDFISGQNLIIFESSVYHVFVN